MSDRRWARRLGIFYKIQNGLTPPYLREHIPKRNVIDTSLRNRKCIAPLARTERYSNSFFRVLSNPGKIWIMERSLSLLSKVSKGISKALFALPDTLLFDYGINLGLNYSLKLELVFQTCGIIGLITTLIVTVLSVRVALKMKHPFIFSYAVRATLLNVLYFLAKYQK